MKYYLIILLSLPFISFGQTSLFYKTKTTDVIATREVSKTVGLSMNVSFLEDILENSSNYLDVRIPFLDGDLELTLHRFSIINDQLLMI